MTTQRAFGALIALLLAAILVGLWLGTEPARIADLAALLRGEDSPFTRLLLAWRLPRVLAALTVRAWGAVCLTAACLTAALLV